MTVAVADPSHGPPPRGGRDGATRTTETYPTLPSRDGDHGGSTVPEGVEQSRGRATEPQEQPPAQQTTRPAPSSAGHAEPGVPGAATADRRGDGRPWPAVLGAGGALSLLAALAWRARRRPR